MPDVVEPIGEFAKSDDVEEMLQELNRRLAPANDAGYEDLEERFPTLQIIGVPRSGTTLLSQLVATHLDVGYINHLIAAFWRAPLFGIRLSEMLLPGVRPTSFRSAYGRTDGIAEPHEFGYFWRDLLGHDDLSAIEAEAAMVDWSRVRTVITNMCAAFAAPVVFKSFQLTWHMEGFSKALPRTRYVWVRRPPLDTAMSIMRLREGFAGSRDAWVSMKPGAYETLVDQPRADQVAGQVHELESEIATLAGTVPSDAVLELPYERLCADPAGVLDDCAALLGAGGHTPAIVGAPPAGFSPSPLDTTDPDYHAVQAAIARRYS